MSTQGRRRLYTAQLLTETRGITSQPFLAYSHFPFASKYPTLLFVQTYASMCPTAHKEIREQPQSWVAVRSFHISMYRFNYGEPCERFRSACVRHVESTKSGKSKSKRWKLRSGKCEPKRPQNQQIAENAQYKKRVSIEYHYWLISWFRIRWLLNMANTRTWSQCNCQCESTYPPWMLTEIFSSIRFCAIGTMENIHSLVFERECLSFVSAISNC